MGMFGLWIINRKANVDITITGNQVRELYFDETMHRGSVYLDQ